MTEHELKGLKNLNVPAPRMGAKKAALRAALDAFDSTEPENNERPPKGFPRRQRRTHTTSNLPRRRMMRFSRSTYATAASLAVLAIAVPAAVIYMDGNAQREGFADHQQVGGILDMYSSNAPATGQRASQQLAKRDSDGTPPAEPKKETRVVPTVAITSEKDAANKPRKRVAARPDLRVASADDKRAAPQPSESAPIAVNRNTAVRPFSGLTNQTPGITTGVGIKIGPIGGPRERARKRAPAGNFGFVTTASNDRSDAIVAKPPQNRDRFDGAKPNPIKQVATEPVSTFSIDVDTSSYSFIRRALNSGQMPRKDAVRVEELINYFTYDYARPDSASVPFKPSVTVLPSPWNANRQLVHIGLKGYELSHLERPRANLVFLIDISGSMASSDKLALLKQGLSMLLDKLRPDDTVGIVTYASGSGVALEPTKLSQKAKIQSAIARLGAGGSTAGAQGIQDAYRLAQQAFDKEAVNRVILGTDGDFNVGITDRGQLKSFIEEKRKTGIFLSVLGFGRGNYNDALMQALAQNGNGTAAYIDTLSEARKVLIEEASSTLFPIAKDVKIQIEFNPAVVSDYRLVGYETRALRREDFNNDKVDAGDVGSGHSVTAIYEITPVGADVKTVDDLRYQKPATPTPAAVRPSGETNGELAFLKLRYKLPNEDTSKLLTMPVMTSQALGQIGQATADVRFAIAVASFGQILRGDPWVSQKSYDDIVELAISAKGEDSFGLRAQFVELVRLAKALSNR